VASHHAGSAVAPSFSDAAKQDNETSVFADAFSVTPPEPAAYADSPFWESPQPDLSAPLRLVPPPSPEKVAPPPPAASSPNARRVGPSAPAVGPAADPNSLGEQLKRALEGRFKPLLAIALDGARQVALDGDDLSIAYAPDKKHLRDSLAKPESLKLLREVCRGLLGRDVNVSVVVNDGRAANDSPTEEDEEQRERRRLREIAENHPAVQQLLRTFRAEIIDVRQLETEP
jgi:DNA polymerase-3 subunit gamma/tau